MKFGQQGREMSLWFQLQHDQLWTFKDEGLKPLITLAVPVITQAPCPFSYGAKGRPRVGHSSISGCASVGASNLTVCWRLRLSSVCTGQWGRELGRGWFVTHSFGQRLLQRQVNEETQEYGHRDGNRHHSEQHTEGAPVLRVIVTKLGDLKPFFCVISSPCLLGFPLTPKCIRGLRHLLWIPAVRWRVRVPRLLRRKHPGSFRCPFAHWLWEDPTHAPWDAMGLEPLLLQLWRRHLWWTLTPWQPMQTAFAKMCKDILRGTGSGPSWVNTVENWLLISYVRINTLWNKSTCD